MKSYILPRAKLDYYEETSVLLQTDFMKKEYRNLITETSFFQTQLVSNTERKAVLDESTIQNLFEDTNTKEMKYEILGSQFFNTGFKPTKQDSEGYDFIVIKFNKLNPIMINTLKRYFSQTTSLGIQIFFSDVNTFAWDEAETNVLTSSATSHPSPLAKIGFAIGKEFVNWEEGTIILPPLVFKDFLNRSGIKDGKCYHRYFALFVPVSIGSEFYISDITVSNAIEVEFENNIEPDFKNLTETKKNTNGVKFDNILNTQKKMKLSIPMITAEKLMFLQTNFFNKHKNSSFYISPLSSSVYPNIITDSVNYYETYVNKYLSGHYTFKTDYSFSRDSYNNYNVEFEVEEVI